MRTITPEFEAVQLLESNGGIRRVQYKRRKWNQATRAFEWEADWSTVGADRFVSVSSISHELDTDLLNEFKVSNVTINLQNADYFYRFDNPFGFFAKDSGSPFHLYEPYWTKFRVQAGFILADDSEEFLTLFTGVATEFTTNDDKVMQIQVQGLEALLTNTKAEEIATEVDQENAGTGNSSDVDFLTDNPGVGGITLVTIDGFSQIEGEHYSVSQLNEATLPAKVTFENAPDVGEIVRISYFYWDQDLEFHTLVESLLVAAGISSYEIEPVVFENSVLNSQEYTSQADWQTGVATNLDSTTFPGSLILDVDDADFRTATNWENSISGWTAGGVTGNWASDGTKLTASEPAGLNINSYIYRASNKAIGNWQFKFTMDDNEAMIYFYFLLADASSTGYAVKIEGGDGLGGKMGIIIDSLNSASSGSVSVPWTFDTSQHTITVSRRSDGTMKLYFDGVLMQTTVDTNFNTGGVIAFNTENGGSVGGFNITVDDIYVPVDTLTGSWISPTIDANATPAAWQPMVISADEGGGSLVYSTATSADDMSYDPYQEASAQNIPQSTLRQYTKVKIEFSIDSNSSGPDPQVNALVHRWITAGVTVTLPGFTGLSVYEALQNIGEFANYEYGFDADESFFFRPKSTSDSVLSLNQSNFAAKISGMTSGYEKMYGIVRATYGDITREISSSADSPISPLARLEQRRFEINTNSDIQIPASADIATGVAQGLLSLFSKRRRRMKVETKFLPQLELSDVVNIEFVNNTPEKVWYLGDPQVNLGDEDVNLWGDVDQLVDRVDFKIIGARYDVSSFRCEFDVEEVV